MSKMLKSAVALSTLLSLSVVGLSGASVAQDSDPDVYKNMKWRGLGPSRGGRSTASAGIEGQPRTYYMGTSGGGVWKTSNAGMSWANVSDGFFGTGTIGAIDVADSDPNVVYVGTGSAPLRGMKESYGDGIYKSTDAGKTWTNVGLPNTRQIARIRVHPTNPDIVYVAAQGNPWGPNEERGIFVTKDGGKTWNKTLYVNASTGGVDITIDQSNPRNLIAAMWDHQRTPWQVRSGGGSNSSAIYKSTDGGDTWKKTGKGLPSEMGKIGVDISQANPNRVFAIIEAEGDKGGMYRSDDGGANFKLMNSDHILKARSWYYHHIFADPKNENVVWVLNAPIMKSIDGGKTFKVQKATHGDNHDLWINPSDTNIMINANDGGASVTMDGGKSWSAQNNQPTMQVYRLSVDNQTPYRVYGSQQDNSTMSLPSRSLSGSIGQSDWEAVGGGESAHIAFDPDNPEFVYATNIVGGITEWTRSTKQARSIIPYPERMFSVPPKDLKYRQNWNAPVFVSKHDTSAIYYGAQLVLKSTDRGQSWTEISPDLTRNDKAHQGDGGGPFTNEQVSGENYNNIFYLAESSLKQGVIWSGSDDGLVHVTRNDGGKWDNVTPKRMAEMQVNAIEASPHNAGTAYIAVGGMKMGHVEPNVYRTNNYGKSWKKIVKGLPKNTWVRVVREDPTQKGLLYAGTETGMFISYNNGDNWSEFQLDLPETPITDMKVKHGDLIVSTQGRGFWILDDISPVREAANVDTSSNHLFDVKDVVRPLNARTLGGGMGKNPPTGAVIRYLLAKDTAKDAVVNIDIMNASGAVVRNYSSDSHELCTFDPYNTTKRTSPSNKPLLNQWVWNLQTEPLACKLGLLHNPRGGVYMVAPGDYTAKVTVGDYSQSSSFSVSANPNLPSISDGYADYTNIQSAMFAAANDMIAKTDNLDDLVSQVKMISKVSGSGVAKSEGKKLLGVLKAWNAKIINKDLQTFQDIIRYDNKLALKFSFLAGEISGDDVPVSMGSKEVAHRYLGEWATVKAEYDAILANDVTAYNAAMSKAGLPNLITP